jgi:hypothetical protein
MSTSEIGRGHPDDTFDFPLELLHSPRVKVVHDFVEWKYLYYYMNSRPEEREGILHKLHHTNDVIKVIIAIHTDAEDYTLEDAVCAALVHDIARPLQGAFFNHFSDKSTGIEHGDEGARMYSQAFPEDKKVAAATKNHNKLHPEGQGPWIDEIRDADKIAIFIRIFDMMGAQSYKNGDGVHISGKVLEYFANTELVNKKDVVTEADDWLCSLSWIWDFKSQKARQYAAELGLPHKILQYILEHFEVTAQQKTVLQDGVAVWYILHGLQGFLPARPDAGG